jgi:beta-lactam-binding protein with PASTA domain
MLGDSLKRRSGRAKPAPSEAPESAPRWRLPHWLALLAALTLPFVAGYVVAVRILFPPPAVTASGVPVPALVGKVLETAEHEADSVGLGPLEVMQLPSPTEAVGIVIAQSPLAGQQMRNGARIRVAVSTGKPRVLVPDVVGFPVERAASLLSRLGFQVQRIDTESTEPRGQVLTVDPDPGTRLELPARVVITVSQGPPAPPPDTGVVREIGDVTRPIGLADPSDSPIFTLKREFTRLQSARSNGSE